MRAIFRNGAGVWPASSVVRFHQRYEIDNNNCWLWQGRLRDGYGSIKVDGVLRLAHRFAYEICHGQISADLTIDHLCHVRRCVNPLHLQAVSIGENVRRGNNPAAQNARLTACRFGHPFSRAKDGKRFCRTCKAAWEKRRSAKRRALITKRLEGRDE